ncbi:hypothetical protein ACOMHN_042174 [Nucella lapillus]
MLRRLTYSHHPLFTLNTNQSTSCSGNVTPNIVLLKVHKSGSTTVANLLARYALNHNLNVALPNKFLGTTRFNYFSRTRMEQGVIPLAAGQQYNVLFNHMIYNRTVLNRIMPPGTFYCAIMREPLSRFASSAKYYPNMLPKLVQKYLIVKNGSASSTKMHDTILPLGVGLTELIQGRAKTSMENKLEIYNSLAAGSGLPVSLHMDEGAIKEHIYKLDKEFHLVMVMERFIESVVLLKRRVCLHLRDILHFQLNPASKGHHIAGLSEADRAFLLSWQMADVLIYEYFYHKFNAEVAREGDSFQQEVQHFRKTLARTDSYCHNDTLRQNDVLVIGASPWNDLFTVNAADCELMMVSELNFQRRRIDLFRT